MPRQVTPEAKQRRRVRVALATLRRVEHQRTRFATEYGKATTAHERFVAACNALRAAAAAGAHQPDPDDAARRLDSLTDLMATALNELHKAQEDTANKTIRADERRIRRNDKEARL